jgi:hypothetical protein
MVCSRHNISLHEVIEHCLYIIVSMFLLVHFHRQPYPAKSTREQTDTRFFSSSGLIIDDLKILECCKSYLLFFRLCRSLENTLTRFKEKKMTIYASLKVLTPLVDLMLAVTKPKTDSVESAFKMLLKLDIVKPDVMWYNIIFNSKLHPFVQDGECSLSIFYMFSMQSHIVLTCLFKVYLRSLATSKNQNVQRSRGIPKATTRYLTSLVCAWKPSTFSLFTFCIATSRDGMSLESILPCQASLVYWIV